MRLCESGDSERVVAFQQYLTQLCSGAGLHVGHPEGYTATDIVARYKVCAGL